MVCATVGLPLAWRVETAKAQESTFAVPLLESVRERGSGPRSPLAVLARLATALAEARAVPLAA